mmetsp:Transcript_54118/g.155433  ORF Transcript_54118/g.155433 Transcript_54118/m.155433 type:complete len:242 (-) Transcript_54118:656-1381(-)
MPPATAARATQSRVRSSKDGQSTASSTISPIAATVKASPRLVRPANAAWTAAAASSRTTKPSNLGRPLPLPLPLLLRKAYCNRCSASSRSPSLARRTRERSVTARGLTYGQASESAPPPVSCINLAKSAANRLEHLSCILLCEETLSLNRLSSEETFRDCLTKSRTSCRASSAEAPPPASRVPRLVPKPSGTASRHRAEGSESRVSATAPERILLQDQSCVATARVACQDDAASVQKASCT